MKFAILLLVTLAPCAFAQTDVGKLLAKGLQGAVLGVTPVSEKDQATLLKATAGLLAKHVTFRPDDTASSFFNSNERQQVEWKALVVRSIGQQPIDEADRLNGTTRRCLVVLSCDAHRTWDFKANAWGKWQPIGNPFFPAVFTFDWKNNQWICQQSDQLKRFTPGPGHWGFKTGGIPVRQPPSRHEEREIRSRDIPVATHSPAPVATGMSPLLMAPPA